MMADQESLLEVEVHRLSGALEHLESSNRQLQEALQDAFDREFKTAIEDNIVTIAKFRARRAALQEEIQRLKGLPPAERVHEPEAVALPDAQRTGDQQQGRTMPPAAAAVSPGQGAAAAPSALNATLGGAQQQQQQQQQQQHSQQQQEQPRPAPADSGGAQQEMQQTGTGVWL